MLINLSLIHEEMIKENFVDFENFSKMMHYPLFFNNQLILI